MGRVEGVFIFRKINVYNANNDILGYYTVQKTRLDAIICVIGFHIYYLPQQPYPLPVHYTCYLFTAPVTGTLQVINSYYKKLSTHYSYFSTLFLWFIRHLSTGYC